VVREMSQIDKDDTLIVSAGYKPQLNRSLGLFASFAIPFSLISITTGIFANFGFVLSKAGPFGFWTWPLVSFGLILVALTFAEMAGRIPLTGSVYNWNNKLAGPFIGWMAGWLALSNYTIGTAAITTTMLPVLGIMLGHDVDPQTGACIASALIVIQMIINMYGMKITSHTNVVSVIAEIVSIVVLSILVIVAVINKGHFNFDLLTTIPASPRPYLLGFLMSALIGSWCLTGFESSADVSEETINATRITPKGIMFSILCSAFIGFAFIVVMTLAIPDVATISAAPYPLAAISTYYLGASATNVFLGLALIAMFSCSMVCMTAGSRVLFAMARDGRFIASATMSKISTHHVPKAPLVLITVMSICFTFMTDSTTSLYGAATVCAAIYYLATVVGFGLGAKKLPATPTFSLGCWHWPVVVLATLWAIAEICILTIPEEFHAVAIATAGVLVVGLVIYVAVGRKTTPL